MSSRESAGSGGTINKLVINTIAIGFGIVTMPYTLSVGIGCIAAGSIAIGMELTNPIYNMLTRNREYDEELKKMSNIFKINKVCNNEEEYVSISHVESKNDGFAVELDIPLGLSYKDIEKTIPAISTSFGGKNITLDKNKLIVKYTELEEHYELLFPPLSKKNKNKLITYVGCNLDGLVFLDLSQAGAVLLAGQTGSGKSTLLRYMLTYIAINYDESQINLFLNDLKYTELSLFKYLKITKWHNTDVDKVGDSLQVFWKEIQRRFRLFESVGPECTDAYQYEAMTGKSLPINLMVVEEFTIMSGKQYKEDIELLNKILCQCRASKSHVIITTQRPDAKTLDPRLKANITHTIGLKTKSIINSQIICDEDVLKYLRGDGHGYVFDNKGDREFQGFYLTPEKAIEILKPYKDIEKIKKTKIIEHEPVEELYEEDEF